MSKEHFHESQIEDRVTQLMEEGMSDEDAIQKAESEHDGRVNLVEDQALKIHHIQTKIKMGMFTSEKLVARIGDYLESHSNSDSQSLQVVTFCNGMIDQIDAWRKAIDNAE